MQMRTDTGASARWIALASAWAAAVFAGALAAAPASVLRVTLTGQSMIRSDIRVTAPATVATIQGLLQGEVRFTNLEGTVAEPGQSVRQGRGFLTPPQALAALQTCGFNLLALADNHAFDLGVPGIENTLREADRLGIVQAGTGKTVADAAAPAYLRTPAGTVALLASASGLIGPEASATPNRPGVNELRIVAGDQPNEATADLPGAPANKPAAADAQRILRSIRVARQHADWVIVYQHNHVFANRAFATIFAEGMPERLAPNDWLRSWTHAEVDAGADIVVMHGAPLLHGLEIYRGRPILYDLGNFIYNVPPTLTYIDEPMSWESVIAYVEFQGATLRSISLRPITLNPIGNGQPDVHDALANNEFLDTRGLPTPATGAKARYILERLAELSQPFGTRIEVQGDTASVRLTH